MSMAEAPPPGVNEEVWFKNCLQQYTQRASMPLPVYQTLFAGTPQEPSFKARVWVDGACFTSPNSFSTKKMAEQDAAKHALIGVREKVKSEGSSFVLQATFFCKSIVHEYAMKKDLIPTYVTNQSEAMLPIFVSSLILHGVTYVGDPGRNKREAEQLAARSAILSILGSESSTTMSEIVKSKFKFYEALKKVKDSYSGGNVPTNINSLNAINCSPKVQGGSIPAEENMLEAPGSVNKRKEADVSGGTASGSSSVQQSGMLTVRQLPTTEVELPERSNNTQMRCQHCHEFKKPKLTSLSAAIAPPIVTTSSAAIAPPIVTTSSATKAPPIVTTSSAAIAPPIVTNSSAAIAPPIVTNSSAAIAPPIVATSSAAIAPVIEFVPPAPGQALTCSTSRKKRNRRSKKNKKCLAHEPPLSILMIPWSQLPASSVAQ